MKKFSGLIKSLNKLIYDNGDSQNAHQMEKYFKHTIKAYGLTSPIIKNVYKTFKSDNSFQLKELSFNEKFDLGDTLLRDTFFEQKIIGINIFSEIAKKFEKEHIFRIKKAFEDGCINNWGICDSICGKVLKPWTILNKENSIEISQWSKDHQNIWIRRASCVSFITRVKLKDEKNFIGFTDLMFETCQNNIIYSERFNQLATGWLLRELSLIDKNKFLRFFYQNFKYFTREGIRYSIEKLPEKERKKLLNYRPDDEQLSSKRKK